MQADIELIEVSASGEELVSNNEFGSSDEFSSNDANENSELSETVNTEAKAVTWIECFGKFSHLCSNLMECQELISKVGKLDVPQPENHLGELLDVVERLNSLSSSLLSDTNQALANIKSQQDHVPVFSSTEFIPIDRDPGCRRKILTDEDRVYMIEQGPFQPKLTRYPRNRDIPPPKHCQFSSEWFNTYPHLEYSISKDAVFCFVCQLFPPLPGYRKADESFAAWALNGVQAWHKMKSRGKSTPGKLATHFTSSIHRDALRALLAFQNKSAHVDVLLDKDHRNALIEEEAETQRNREAIKALLDVTRTLARQAISFRGSSSEKEGNGNFRQVVALVARHTPALQRWLDDAPTRPHKVDYLSSRSQNEFLTLLAEDVSNRVVAQIHDAKMFSVIADTTPDVSHVDPLCHCKVC